MITPRPILEYRPKLSTVAPRASRPLGEMCEHFAPKGTCTVCRAAAAPSDRGPARRAAEEEAARVLVEMDARRAKPEPKRKPGPKPKPVRPEGMIKNGMENGVQRWRHRKGSRAQLTPEQLREQRLASLRAAMAARVASARTVELDGEQVKLVDVARSHGLRPTLVRRRIDRGLTVRQALGLDPMPVSPGRDMAGKYATAAEAAE